MGQLTSLYSVHIYLKARQVEKLLLQDNWKDK